MPPAAKEASEAFRALIRVISDDGDVPMSWPIAMRAAKAYKDDLTKDHSNMSALEITKKAKKQYSGESTATKKKYLAKAEKMAEDSKAARKAKKANK